MTGHFTPDEVLAHLKNRRPFGKCGDESKRSSLLGQVQQDIARLICSASDTNYFSYLIAKRGDLALVIGARGDLQNRIVTLELIRRRQRIAYFAYSDPVLRVQDLRQRRCMQQRRGENSLTILADEGSLSHLIAMRSLLYDKLPYKGRVLSLTAE